MAVDSTACSLVVDPAEAELIEKEPTVEERYGQQCAEYCDAVMTNCTGEYAVYSNRIQCLNLCSVLEPGEDGDTTSNTVACRLTNARLAAETAEPKEHCPQAGPGGAAQLADGVSCSSNCAGLCGAMTTLCSEQYASLTACLNDCEGVQDLGGYNTSVGQGATVQCRLFHLAAAAAAPDPHCRHAAGDSPCR